jgi:hypothetical protein
VTETVSGSLTDFLLARCQDVLDSGSCDYEIYADGRTACLCDDPADEVLTTLNRMAFVLLRAELDAVGDVFLRMLADAHLDHPDYRDEWHRLS